MQKGEDRKVAQIFPRGKKKIKSKETNQTCVASSSVPFRSRRRRLRWW